MSANTITTLPICVSCGADRPPLASRCDACGASGSQRWRPTEEPTQRDLASQALRLLAAAVGLALVVGVILAIIVAPPVGVPMAFLALVALFGTLIAGGSIREIWRQRRQEWVGEAADGEAWATAVLGSGGEVLRAWGQRRDWRELDVPISARPLDSRATPHVEQEHNQHQPRLAALERAMGPEVAEHLALTAAMLGLAARDRISLHEPGRSYWRRERQDNGFSLHQWRDTTNELIVRLEDMGTWSEPRLERQLLERLDERVAAGDGEVSVEHLCLDLLSDQASYLGLRSLTHGSGATSLSGRQAWRQLVDEHPELVEPLVDAIELAFAAYYEPMSHAAE